MTYQEKCAEKYGHLHVNTTGAGRGLNKESSKSIKDREPSGSTATDPKSLKHKKHRKRRETMVISSATPTLWMIPGKMIVKGTPC